MKLLTAISILAVSVTRLEESSPIRRLFTTGSVLKDKVVAKMLGLLIFTVQVMCQFLT
jgi:hypothetical protein